LDIDSPGTHPAATAVDPRSISRQELWPGVFVLVVFAFLLYSRNINDYFLGDDFELIRSFFDKPFSYLLKLLVYNESGDIWKHLGLDPETGGYLRPLKIWLLALDFELWGANPVGFHLTSTALFAFVAVMVFLIANRLIGAGGWDCAMFAAFVAAAHPVFAEIVPFITAREEVLTSALIVGTVWAFVRYRTAGKSLGAVCVWLTLALLTKESGIVALLLVLGYEISMLTVERPSLRQLPRRFWPFVPLGIVALAYVVLRIIAFGNPIGGFGGIGYGDASVFLDHQQAFSRMLFHHSMLAFSSIPGLPIIILLLACGALFMAWRARHVLGRRYFANLLFVGPVWYLFVSTFGYGVYFSVRHCIVLVLGLCLFVGLLLYGALAGLESGWPRTCLVVALAFVAGLALIPPGQEMSREFSDAARVVEHVLDRVDQETADLVHPCNVKLVNAPIFGAPPYYFGWGLQSALRLPFRKSRIGERCRVFSDEDSIINVRRSRSPVRYDRILVIKQARPPSRGLNWHNPNGP
jgi:hypothetical protein